MKIIVDRDLCEANGHCVARAPEVFQMDDEGRMIVVDDAPGPALAENVRQAAKRCPRGAIRVVDDAGA